LNTEKRYLLEGHCLRKNDPSYVRVKEKLLDEYIKAVDLLTIDPANLLKMENKELVERQDDITLLKLEHRKEIKELKEQLASLLEDKDKDQDGINRLCEHVDFLEGQIKSIKPLIDAGIYWEKKAKK
jgi:dsDNA-specific endonuclease/ATPase MutS2